MLAPQDVTRPGRSETGVAFGLGGGVRAGQGALRLSVDLRWISMRTEAGTVNIVPLSVGMIF